MLCTRATRYVSLPFGWRRRRGKLLVLTSAFARFSTRCRSTGYYDSFLSPTFTRARPLNSRSTPSRSASSRQNEPITSRPTRTVRFNHGARRSNEQNTKRQQQRPSLPSIHQARRPLTLRHLTLLRLSQSLSRPRKVFLHFLPFQLSLARATLPLLPHHHLN